MTFESETAVVLRTYPGDALANELARDWDLLNRGVTGGHPLLDTKFLCPLAETYADESLLVVTGRRRQQLAFAAILERKHFGVWETFRPAQSCISSLLFDADQDSPAICLRQLFRLLPGRVWLIALQSLDPKYIDAGPLGEGLAAEKVPHWTTTHVDVTGTFDSYWNQRPKTLRASVGRRLRNLERNRIEAQLSLLQTPSDVEAAIREHARLESTGWKGRAGTAIRAQGEQQRFYSSVLKHFAASDGMRVYQLRFNDRVVASLLCVQQGRMLVVLKTAYSESDRKFGPGRLVDFLMLEHVFRHRAARTIEMYTDASSEDAKWCTGTREIFHLNLYDSRSTMGLIRFLRGVKGGFAQLSGTLRAGKAA